MEKLHLKKYIFISFERRNNFEYDFQDKYKIQLITILKVTKNRVSLPPWKIHFWEKFEKRIEVVFSNDPDRPCLMIKSGKIKKHKKTRPISIT